MYLHVSYANLQYYSIWFVHCYLGNLLSESDIRILAVILTEHLHNLKERGLNLNQGERISKEEVVIQLKNIGQHELAEILRKDRGKT